MSEKKRLPLRWLTLAELVGVAALVIAGLGYWDAHRERTQSDRERADAAREQKAERALKQSFLMLGTPDKDGAKVRLGTVHPEQVIQTQTLWFPAEVRADSVETTGNPRVEAGWIEDGLRKAVAKAGGKSKRGRLPVAVVTTFIEDGQTRTDRAIYQLGYSLHPRVLLGARVELEGLTLARRGVTGDLQAAANGMWTAP